MTTTPIFPPETLHRVAPKDLVPNPLNPRGDITPDKDMTASIAERGVLQAISAFERDGKLVVIAGHRRRANAIAAKAKTVPVIVKAEPEVGEQLADMLVENDGELRKGLSALQEAGAYQALITAGWTQSAVAQKVSKAQSHITKRLALLKLPEEIVDKVEAGTVTFDAAYELSKISNPRVVKELTKYGNPSPHSLRTALEKQTRGDAAAKESIKLKAAGTRVVSLSQLGNGTAALLPCDLYANNLGVKLAAIAITDAKAHAKQPCHAVAVFPKLEKGSQTLPVCDNPAAHPKTAIAKFAGTDWQKLSATNIADQAAKDAKNPTAAPAPAAADDVEAQELKRKQDLERLMSRFDELAMRTSERRVFLSKLIKTPGRPAQTGLLQAATALTAFCDVDYYDVRVAFALLAVETGPTPDSQLEALFRGSPKDSSRAALAVAGALLETRLFCVPTRFDLLEPMDRRSEDAWNDLSCIPQFVIKRYLDWLAADGFELGPIETAALAQCAADRNLETK